MRTLYGCFDWIFVCCVAVSSRLCNKLFIVFGVSRSARFRRRNTTLISIMEAIREGDAQLAEKLADEHICNAYKNMVKCGLSEEKNV